MGVRKEGAPTKIGLVASFYPDVKGGAAVAIDALLGAYAQACVNWTLFTMAKNPAAYVSLERLGRIPGKLKVLGPPGFDLLVERELLRALSLHHVDLLHVQDTYALIGSASAARKRAIPLLLSYHNNVNLPHVEFGVPRLVASWLDRREGRMLGVARRCCSMVVANSLYTAEELVRAGLPRERVRMVYIGGAVSDFAEPQPRPERRRFCAAAAGRLVRHKGFETLIWAVRRLAVAGTELDIVIAGDGPDRSRLIMLTRQCDVSDRFQFIGSIERRRLMEFYDSADVVVVPTLTPEPFGRVAVEAMSRGRPVIASDAGALPEIVVDGQTGLLVPPANPAALAGALAALIEDRNLRNAMADRALNRSRQLFDATVATTELLDLYAAVLQ